LKSFREDFYEKICRARLQPVLNSIRLMKKLGIWVEVTTLVVTGLNDSEGELTQIARFIADVDPDIPWHLSRFHPDYKYTDAHPTPVETLKKAFSIGKKEGLRYLYIGNVWGESVNTSCPECGKTLIKRSGFSATGSQIMDSKCSSCGHLIAGVF
jgi:pyruvate formate lyase activating enzyme